jgi:two-component system chemotaxis sensor kinase CheA
MEIGDVIGMITDKILKYDSGDVILVQEIIDYLEPLKKQYGEGTMEPSLLLCLISICESEMRAKGPPNFQGSISQGLDIFQTLSGCADPERRKRLEDKAASYIAGNSKQKAPPEQQAPDADKSADRDILSVFLSESSERMERAQAIILDLENDLGNRELVNELFRVFHTIKGECGFLKLTEFGELAHNVENVLDLLRNSKIGVDARLIDILLEGIDLSKLIIKSLLKGEMDMPGKATISDYVERLERTSSGVKPAIGEILLKTGKVTESDLDLLLREQRESGFGRKLGEIAVEANLISPKELNDGLEAQKHVQQQPEASKVEAGEQLLKVKASKVNYLVDMIGELLIALGQVQDKSSAFAQVRKISKSLQHAAMELRTESVKVLIGNAKRVVRDVSRKLGKTVGMETFGEDLEIDRKLIDKLDEPLMHIVRNSLDHGIEPEEERTRKGKPAQGTLTIGAERRGNNIVISIADDGQGLDRERILRKAMEKGLVPEKEAGQMSDSAVFNLIFISGFSTKESIDYVSGRGVGMDIVKSAVTAAKGRIEIQTERGKYTRLLLIFPLSTAIIEGMLVRLGSNTFIIPIASIIESVSLKRAAISEIAPGTEVMTVRGEVIPLIRLAQAIGLEGVEDSGGVAVIVENADKRKFTLMVDEILAKREVVIKSLGSMFRDLKGISSGTVLAEGKIGLVLDVDQVVALGSK